MPLPRNVRKFSRSNKIMVDTVKLMFEEGQYEIRDSDAHYLTSTRGVRKITRNTSASEMRAGLYLPRYTLVDRPTMGGRRKSLIVEFSAPKLLFGNNFDELIDADFSAVCDKLINTFAYLGIVITEEDIVHAKVVGWHPSKNIVFNDVLGCMTVINALETVAVSKIFTVQKTDFSDGEILHFHCNSKDIAFYDKLADLRKGKISDKRALENDNRLQQDLISQITGVSILRYELRLNGVKTVKRSFGERNAFANLFNADLNQRLLLDHWSKLTQDLDYLSLDTHQAINILERYIKANTNATPRTALAATASILIASQAGAGRLRNIMSQQYGAHSWYAIKPLLTIPQASRFEALVHAETTIKAFKPTRVSSLVEK